MNESASLEEALFYKKKHSCYKYQQYLKIAEMLNFGNFCFRVFNYL